jgi:hypothetical protein
MARITIFLVALVAVAALAMGTLGRTLAPVWEAMDSCPAGYVHSPTTGAPCVLAP